MCFSLSPCCSLSPLLLPCRYADNILKTFAVGCSIVLNCFVSSGFLGVPLTLQLLVGVLLVVGSTCLFNARALKPTDGDSQKHMADENGERQRDALVDEERASHRKGGGGA